MTTSSFFKKKKTQSETNQYNRLFRPQVKTHHANH